MIPSLFYKVSFALLLFGSPSFAEGEARPEKPNIVLILTDDLGWQDVKCYDIDEPCPYETPHIDALAKKGVMFWQAYSPTPVCSSSRCAIMSGNHAARAQKTSVQGGAPPQPLSKKSRMMDPWYSGRMPADEWTLAKALGQNGYVTGHSGKWHIAINHNAFPQPTDVGFDYSRSSRGSRAGMQDRLTGFATDAADDPFRLDENGYPLDETNEDALTFLKENKQKPFFLYYATWLVHSPMHTRAEAHLKKYAERLGVDPAEVVKKEIPGQKNPFFASMVQEVDYYLGQVFAYLDTTEDPRWPGHMLSENTYLIFTSDNGGMEGPAYERYTDNNPLDRGKISSKEGGTRVPLIVTGPGVPAGVQTDVMANGLDFYPTILSLTGATKPEEKSLDGCDLSPLLLGDPTNPALVKCKDGSARDTMMWHFPHGGALESSIRIGDYKLIRKYDHVQNPNVDPLELYQLYETKDGKQTRVDIEEANSLASAMPEKAEEMNQRLTEMLTEMKASYPSYNPLTSADLPHKSEVPVVLSQEKKGSKVEFTYESKGAQVKQANLIYTLNRGDRYEEWFSTPATITSESKVNVALPEGTNDYVLNLIDENDFLVSYPALSQEKKRRKKKK